jgi:aminocarboxymuconate-semialdehyde decarboxylase
MPVIDVHTHMMSDGWLAMLKEKAAPDYAILPIAAGKESIHEHGAPFLTLTPGMFDYPLRIKAMDAVGVDIAIVSLTAPSVYWGGAEDSAKAARLINDDMRAAQAAYPGRIRFLATLPWQHPQLAVAELKRACDLGAVGVMVLANIRGRHLTEPEFAPIWQAIDERALPVLVHPTTPPGYRDANLLKYNLVATVGFVYDTTLAITRMVMDGFLDRFPNVKIIAAHGGGTLPYINARIDKFFELTAPSREKISIPPTEYFQRIYYDAVVYQMNSLSACIDLAGPSHVMYGSDYPHQTGDMKGCLARVDALPPDQRDAIRGTNAQRVFGL